MPRETRSDTPSPARFGDRATGSRSSVNGIFRKEGEYWTLSLTTAEVRLKHRKGLHYIAYLLRYPGEEFSAQDLISALEPSESMPAATAVDESRQTDTIGRSLGDTGAIWTRPPRRSTKRGSKI